MGTRGPSKRFEARIQVFVSTELVDQLNTIATRRMLTLSDVAREAIQDYLAKQGVTV